MAADTDRPFRIAIPEAALEDLRVKLAAARLPGSVDDDSWEDGTSLAFVERLVDYWLHRFDWRAQEERLNRLPNRMITIGDQDIHFVHQRGVGPSPMPLMLTHGWPGSFAEMERIIPMLADPGAHGGDPADAFHVVVPSLPGYGFSSAPARAGVASREIAAMWRQLMLGLGYDRFGAQGGDIGAGVSIWLARIFPESLAGLHLNYFPGGYRPPLGEDSPSITPEEQLYLDHARSWSEEEGAYAAMQATRPQTLAFALSDSPVGLAAWIAEKFRSWTDSGGDLESVVSLDTLLTDVCLHWFSDGLTSSLRLYRENRRRPLAFEAGERVDVPLGVALFPRELPMPPRSWLKRVFDVRRWTPMPAGGHFAALEQPKLLAEDVRTFFRPLR